MNIVMRACAGILVLAATAGFGAEGVPTLVQVVTTNGQAQVDLSWASDADTFYEIYSTTNLATGPWTLAVAEPLSSTNLIGRLQLLSADKSRFFQIRKLDTQGPALVSRYPGPSDVGVGRLAPLTVTLADPSGLDTNSFRLTVNGTTLLFNGSAGVTVTTNSFVYEPGTNFWGGYGGTATVSFACLDLKGNATYAEWSFCLEVLPVVADNLLHLATVQPMKATDARSLMSLRPQPGVLFLSGLTLIEQTTNTLVFVYSGTHGMYVGAVLVSHDASNPFYRKITSLTDDPANGRVTAFTQDVPLTDIVQAGSFSPEIFIPVGGQPQALGLDGDLSIGIPFTYNHEFATGTLEWPNVRLRPSELKVKLDGSLELSCQIRDWQVTALGADIASSLDMEVRSRIEFYGELISWSRTSTLGSAPLGMVGGMIGPVPVWIELKVGVDLTFEAKSEGSISFDTGYDVYSTVNASLDWTAAGGLSHTYGGSIDVVPVPLDVPVKLSAEANLYLKPRLSALVCSCAGVSLDFRRGPCLKAEYRLGDEQCAITLSDKWSVNGALTIVGVDDGNLPGITFLEVNNIIKTWYWPEIPETAPSFTLQPTGGSYAQGAAVTLAASASGSPAPAYQWYQNGAALPGKTAATYGFTMGAAAAGAYTCTARNRLGSATSQTAVISLPASAPAGMALIPAGSFQMGNSLDNGLYEKPVHTVYVSAFHMDRTEVTKAKWDGVYAWAITHGYSFDFAGSGKASTHPVHTVNWYDCVKWCNARSEKEGRTPAYYTSTAKTTVYRTGQAGLQNDWVRWDKGYRLPTEAEWEKAARGGLSGKRFPWGDTISQTRANYYSSWSGGVPVYTYDTNPTAGNHPSYATGGAPYTSPADAFAPNGYGLYDMAGNVLEWCWDRLGGYGTSPGSDPRGPVSGSPRVIRGGSWWDGSASGCRSSSRPTRTPDHVSYDMGFRAVLPPGQQ